MADETAKEIHVGKLLRKFVDERRINQSAQARRSGINARIVASYFKKSSIQISSLIKVCHGFKYNFLRQIADMLPPEYPPHPVNPLQTENDALKKEVEDLKKEIGILRDLLKKG
jgi:hypothetical protein